jgi:CheY-like chemotaxis protein
MMIKTNLEGIQGVNFNIDTAFGGMEAVKLFKEKNFQNSPNNYHYIIMDIQMPMVNGIETSMLIHEKITKENYVYAKIIGVSNIEFDFTL